MKPPPFEYADPDSLDELLALLAEAGDEAAIISGGQSLVPLLNLRLARPSLVLDPRRIPGLDRYDISDGALRAGAMTRVADVEADPACRNVTGLAESISHIGHGQIRARTTFGGSVAHADPAAELPALMLALDGHVTLASAARGRRTVASADFFTGPLMTVRADDEMVVEVVLPRFDGRLAVREVAKRPGDFAIVGCVAGYATYGDAISDPRVVVFGASPTAVRVPAAEAALAGQRVGGVSFSAAADAVRESLDPSGDLHASADFRRHVTATLVERALAAIGAPS